MKIHYTLPAINYKKIIKWLIIVLAGFTILMTIFFYVLKANMGKIQTTIEAELNQQINGEVSTGEMNITLMNHFPHFSLIVNDVQISDNHVDEHHEQLFRAKKIYFQIRVFKLLQKKIEFRAITLIDADLNLVRLSSGPLNSKGLIKPKKQGSDASSNTMLLNRIYLKNVRLNYSDSTWGKHYDLTFKDTFGKLRYAGSTIHIQTKDRIDVAGLTFKPNRGSCLTNKTLHSKLNIEFDRDKQFMTLKQSTLEVDKNKFTIEGSFRLGIVPFLDLHIKSKSIQMDDALNYVSEYSREKLKGYHFDKPLPISLSITGAVNPALPMEVDLNFNTKKNTFTTPTKIFKEVSLTGHYYNHLHDLVLNDEKNSAVSLTSFSGKYEGIPFKMDLYAKDLTAPIINTHIKCNFPLTDVNNALDTSILVFKSGTLNLDATFTGSLAAAQHDDPDSMDAVIYGKAMIQNAACRMPQKKYEFNKINGNIDFNGKALQVTSLSFNLNENPVKITASISQFVNSLVAPNVSLIADAEVYCEQFNLDKFKKPVEINAMPETRKRIATIVNSVLTNLQGNIKLHIGTIKYKKIKIDDVAGNVTMNNRTISCSGISMRTANGKFTLDGSLNGMGSKSPSAAFTTTISNADIQQVFYQFDNFNQPSITSANLRGTLNATISFNASLTRSFAIDPTTMAGKFTFSVTDGELLNMDALTQITKNIFKKKDFSNIQFAELKNTSTLTGIELNIEEMEIQSNVLTMYVQGIYSFGDSTELFIRVPVKSLKVQDDDYIAENKAVDEKIGLSINLKATKKDGKMKISPVLFHKSN